MIREDRELLVELASVNTDVVPLAMRIMEESTTPDELHEFADRLVALGQRLHHRADGPRRVIVEGTVLAQPAALPLDDCAVRSGRPSAGTTR